MKKPRKSRPIARIALKQRELITPYSSELDDIHEPVDNHREINENLGRVGGTHSPSRGEDPPLKGPPPTEPVKKPCGCGGTQSPPQLKPDGSRLTPREHLQRYLDLSAKSADREKRNNEAAQLQLFDELAGVGHR